MKKDVMFFALGLLLLAGACNKESIKEIGIKNPTDRTVESVTFTISDFINGDEATTTKTSFVEGGGFLWSANDTVGIYPNTGSQVWFELSSGAEASSASFDGGGWAFKGASVYYSYYPFIGNIYLDRNHIPVSYVGQKQVGTSSTSHIGPYDFMYTPGSSSESGNVSFQYHHLNSLLYLIATLPAGTYKKMAITAPTKCFVEKGWYDLMSAQPAIVADTYTDQVLINLEDVTLETQTNFLVYLMLAPVNLNGVEVTVSALNSQKKEFQCKKTPTREYVAGRYYGLDCASFTEVPASQALIVDDEPSPESIIYYTSDTGEIIEPFAVDVFGANLASNLYKDGRGVMTFDGDVTSIGEQAFSGCSSLTSITIPASVTSIGEQAFSGCNNLSSITIPNSVESIGEAAFEGCSSLTGIAIPGSVTSISGLMFSDCSSLASISIPASVTDIGEAAFAGCSSLASIVIPDLVESIGNLAFDGCALLTSITIPASVTNIGKGVFAGCVGLTAITALPTTPPTAAGELLIETDCPIFVPSGSVRTYKYAQYWRTYANNIQAISNSQ